jgi:hypothetical protein
LVHYLSSVLDLGGIGLIGWKMDDNIATPLVADALDDHLRSIQQSSVATTP